MIVTIAGMGIITTTTIIIVTDVIHPLLSGGF